MASMKVILFVRVVWAHFCNTLNVATESAFGYVCYMEPFKEKSVHLYQMKCLV
jgi:hypothetical protein